MFRPVWIEINLKALESNFRKVRKIVGTKTKIIATVKQEAYGHGLVPIAKKLSTLGVDFFGVGSLDEAILLRKNRIREPILVLTSVLDRHCEYFVAYNIRPTVVDIGFAKKLNQEAKKKNKSIPIHIKIDTGMGRIGPWHKEAEEFIEKTSLLKHLRPEGIFTHFPVADTDEEYTKRQIKWFNNFIKNMEVKGIRFKYKHASNSAALIKYKEAHFDMVRPGLILYGVKPHSLFDFQPTPLLSLKARVTFVKKVAKGRSISYGRTHITKQPTSVATVSIGYADGYPWSLSNKAKVILKGRLFGVIGRVCMDHIMIDIGDSDIKAGDLTTLIGKDKKCIIKAEDLASWAKTIPYEIVSRLSHRLPRIYHP